MARWHIWCGCNRTYYWRWTGRRIPTPDWWDRMTFHNNSRLVWLLDKHLTRGRSQFCPTHD